MTKKIKLAIGVILIIIIIAIALLFSAHDNSELRTIKSEKELEKIYEGYDYSEAKEWLINIIAMPFKLIFDGFDYYSPRYYSDDPWVYRDGEIKNNSKSTHSGLNPQEFTDEATTDSSSKSSLSESLTSKKSKDYSTTNIQVENVDEADITKTDGDYIYSISDDNVIITNVQDPQNVKIEATINSTGGIPEDLILYNDKLVVISTTGNYTSSYSYSNSAKTRVDIYDIQDREYPQNVKNFELNEPYYTSRCINNELYIISSGKLRKENNKVERKYSENREEKEIPLNRIKYLKEIDTNIQTLVATTDLNNSQKEIDLSSYLIDISNAYVSENSIYLLNQKYEYSGYNEPGLKELFSLKGVFGLIFFDDGYKYDSGYKTEIFKFDILKTGEVTYNTNTKIEGKTINQYSLDEQNGHLRIALFDENGARVAIFDDKLKQIGISSYVAKGETMYSSRFMGNKVYLVTYQTIDPLFVIDLSNETKPQVLGELKIPGYSTYLHPYDENHLIGIGMQTEETINKNSSGKVTSTTARIVGMKMALFDVSNVNRPKQISETVIGDRRTTSAILTNPKALLFSKEKELIAIPVNNYAEDFEVTESTNSYSSIVSSYTSYSKPRTAEGYFVYKINIEDGFKLKGVITHEVKEKNTTYNSYYYYASKLLRGMYIDDNLFTVSETAVKVNNLDTLDLVSELRIKE